MKNPIFLALLLLSPADAQVRKAPSPPAMKCETGPLTKMLGGTRWIVYSCDDKASMVVIAANGNPAFPFIFYLQQDAGTYKIVGEGTGDKNTSDKAGADLARLSPNELMALLADTQAIGTLKAR